MVDVNGAHAFLVLQGQHLSLVAVVVVGCVRAECHGHGVNVYYLVLVGSDHDEFYELV